MNDKISKIKQSSTKHCKNIKYYFINIERGNLTNFQELLFFLYPVITIVIVIIMETDDIKEKKYIYENN